MNSVFTVQVILDNPIERNLAPVFRVIISVA